MNDAKLSRSCPSRASNGSLFYTEGNIKLSVWVLWGKKKFYKTNYLLKKLSLEEKTDSYVRYLSGGMKRRLMIAKAMVHTPPILILDEPTAGVCEFKTTSVGFCKGIE